MCALKEPPYARKRLQNITMKQSWLLRDIVKNSRSERVTRVITGLNRIKTLFTKSHKSCCQLLHSGLPYPRGTIPPTTVMIFKVLFLFCYYYHYPLSLSLLFVVLFFWQARSEVTWVCSWAAVFSRFVSLLNSSSALWQQDGALVKQTFLQPSCMNCFPVF